MADGKKKDDEMCFIPVFHVKHSMWCVESVLLAAALLLVNTVGLFTRGFHLLMSKS